MNPNYPPAPPPNPGQPGPRDHRAAGPQGQVPFPSQNQPWQQQGYSQYQQAPSPTAEEARAVPRPNTGFGAAVLAALAWLVLHVIVMFTAFPPEQGSAAGAGAAVGRLLLAMLVGALGAWLVVRRRRTGLPFWQLVLLTLPFYLLGALIVTASMLSQMNGAG